MFQQPLDQMNAAQAGASAQRVGFGPRFGAILIDVVLILVLAVLLAPLAAKIGSATVNTSSFTADLSAEEREAAEALGGLFGAIVGIVIGFVVASFLYNLVEAFTGGSLGKHILGLTIAHESGQKGNLSLWLMRWALKNIGYILSFITLLLGINFLDTAIQIINLIILLSALMMLAQHRQALYDKISKAAVFYKKDLN